MTEQKNALALVQRAPHAYQNPQAALDFVAKFGASMYESGMFGCKSKAQGHVLAMACFCDQTNPIAIKRQYHLIKGELSMRADAMLAGLRARGGKYKVISRTPDKAEIEIVVDGNKQRFALTWEECQKEPFVRTKDGEIKDNYKTPRARMQMMWCRVVSDGVRVMMPEVVAGAYTPEEIADVDGGILDVEFDVVSDGEIVTPADPESPEPQVSEPEDSTPIVETEPSHSEAPSDSAPAQEGSSDAQAEASSAENSKPAPTAAPSPGSEEPAGVSEDQIQKMLLYVKKLSIATDVWQGRILATFGKKKARELTHAEAENILAMLAQLAEVKGMDDPVRFQEEVDAWVSHVLGGSSKN